jgi:hypothetical protein
MIRAIPALLLVGCASPAAPREPPPWAYDVTITPDGREAEVRIRPPRDHAPVHFERGGEAFVTSFREVEGEIRYRYRFEDAASALVSMSTAIGWDGAYVSSTSVWLAHPAGSFPFTLRTHGPFASGLPRVGGGAWTGNGLAWSPFAVIGPWHTHAVQVGASTLTVAISPSHFAADEQAIARWVRETGTNIAATYGRFPLPQALIVVVPQDGSVFATTVGGGAGGSILMPITRDTSATELNDEWALTHEMLHLAFPSVAVSHRWIDEGLATYYEPLVRARAGIISADDVWHDVLTDGRGGLPAPGDAGLEHTAARERVYWGGALFWLSVDVAIRERTHNARSIEDAMRAVLDDGASVSVVWDIQRILDTCDRALGAGIVREHHARLGLAPGRVDLDGLSKRLGVALVDDKVVYDDAAPLAAVRRALTQRR